MGVLLRRELDAELLGLPDAEARVAGPDLGLRVVVGSQAQRVDVEAAERAVSVDGIPTKSTLLIMCPPGWGVR